jgi:hypothetical protein
MILINQLCQKRRSRGKQTESGSGPVQILIRGGVTITALVEHFLRIGSEWIDIVENGAAKAHFCFCLYPTGQERDGGADGKYREVTLNFEGKSGG